MVGHNATHAALPWLDWPKEVFVHVARGAVGGQGGALGSHRELVRGSPKALPEATQVHVSGVFRASRSVPIMVKHGEGRGGERHLRDCGMKHSRWGEGSWSMHVQGTVSDVYV